MKFLEGVSVAASLEFRQRIRAGRWKWILAGWFFLNLAITGLMFWAFGSEDDYGYYDTPTGVSVFGYLMFFSLALLLLVTPSLTAQSVNGDRERGTLATLQVTRLSALEIAVGKLLAAWLTGVVFVVLLIPLALLCMFDGGLPVANVVSVFSVMILLVGVICSISLAISSLFRRSTTSTVMSYMAVFVLTVVTAIVFALVSLFFVTTKAVEYTGHSGTSINSVEVYEETESRTDLIWWLIAPNPVVVLADATPSYPKTTKCGNDFCDPNTDALRSLSDAVRSLRADPFAEYDYTSEEPEGKAVWPYGLAFDLLLAIGAIALTARRLNTPTAKLPRGQRVA